MGVMILSKMLLIDWLALEVRPVIHVLTKDIELGKWVCEVAQTADLPELVARDLDGSIPDLSSEEVRKMLRSAARGHEEGRKFASDVICWRHGHGHAVTDGAVLIELFGKMGGIVG